MPADNDEILDALYYDWKGTAIYIQDIKSLLSELTIVLMDIYGIIDHQQRNL